METSDINVSNKDKTDDHSEVGDNETDKVSIVDRKNSSKRQQFTTKQRIDIYAFCVLELELNGNKVSAKKQQQAIEKVFNNNNKLNNQNQKSSQSGNSRYKNNDEANPNLKNGESDLTTMNITSIHANNTTLYKQEQISDQLISQETIEPDFDSMITEKIQVNNASVSQLSQTSNTNIDITNHTNHDISTSDIGVRTIDGSNNKPKTLSQLQSEAWSNRECYSDIQRTQVLTSSMLREVQKRFAKYYPKSAIPSRTTIKHVFSKCVSHGTVENIKNPRKSTKIVQGDEIEHLLLSKPHLSLRQMAQKLNVSTGTISRRCKALGLVPDSVAIKHQHLAIARREKQIRAHQLGSSINQTQKQSKTSSRSTKSKFAQSSSSTTTPNKPQ